MRTRVWQVGLFALALVALAVGVVLSRAREGSRPERVAASGKDDSNEVDVRLQPGRSARTRRSVGDWPTPNSGPLPSVEESPVEVDAAALVVELQQQIEAIRSSGPGSADLLRGAEAVSRPWETIARASGMEIDVRPWDCYRLGCFVTAVHLSRRSVDEMTSKILASGELAKWPGTKTQSAPIPKPDGRFEVTWLLYVGPDAGADP